MHFIIGLLLLSFLIAFHEAGHMVVAKMFNVKVEIYSLGVGPKLFGYQGEETEYRVSLLPFGGYVKMLGQDGAGNQEELTGVDSKRSMEHADLWKRTLIILAGPFANLTLGVVFAVIGFTNGTVVPAYTFDPVQIKSVIVGSAADSAGFQSGDLIVGINEKPVGNWSIAGKLLLDMHGAKNVPFHVDRGGQRLNIYLDIPDRFDDRSLTSMGLTPGKTGKIKLRLPVLEAIPQSLKSFWRVTNIFVSSMVRAVTFKADRDEFGGPVAAVQVMGNSVTDHQSSVGRWMIMLGVISFQLGLFNLVPIYPLDGAHLLGYLWLAVVRRPPGRKTSFVIRYSGVFVLMSMVVVLMFKDFGLI